jgi:hypothetical protein
MPTQHATAVAAVLLTGNSTRYRVLVGKDDTAGEYFTVEVLIRPMAYGLIKGKQGCWSLHLNQLAGQDACAS